MGHRLARNREGVESRGVAALRVEPVGTGVMRVGQTERGRPFVHEVDEALDVAVADVGGERPRGVVRALHEGSGQEFAHSQPFSGLEVESRLADPRCRARHPDLAVGTRVLEGQDRGHDLRDAGDGPPLVRVERIEDGAIGVRHHDRLCPHGRRGRLGRAPRRPGERGDK
jgi:hypothetical protein